MWVTSPARPKDTLVSLQPVKNDGWDRQRQRLGKPSKFETRSAYLHTRYRNATCLE